jgi:hypothetical protein
MRFLRLGLGALADRDPNSREQIERARNASPTTDMVCMATLASVIMESRIFLNIKLEGAGVRYSLTVRREFREDASFRPHLRAAPRIGNAPTSPCHLQRRMKDARRRFLHAEQASAVNSPKAYAGLDGSIPRGAGIGFCLHCTGFKAHYLLYVGAV